MEQPWRTWVQQYMDDYNDNKTMHNKNMCLFFIFHHLFILYSPYEANISKEINTVK